MSFFLASGGSRVPESLFSGDFGTDSLLVGEVASESLGATFLDEVLGESIFVALESALNCLTFAGKAIPAFSAYSDTFLCKASARSFYCCDIPL